MLRKFAVTAAVTLAMTPSLAFSDGDVCGCWRPDRATIAEIERQAAQQLAGKPLSSYARYYVGVTNLDRPFIRGLYLPAGDGRAAGIHVSDSLLPPLTTEGCRVHVTSVEPVRRPRVSCTRPGAWLPSESDVDRIESQLVMPGTRPLEAYGRYYAGVTVQGRRVIRGVLVTWSGYPAGRHRVTEPDLPVILDGGCSNIALRADPSTDTVVAKCDSAPWPKPPPF